MSLTSSPLDFFLSRKPLGFPDKSPILKIYRKPLGKFTPEPTLNRSLQQRQISTPCLGQQIQAQLFTHPLIAASGIATSADVQTQQLQRSRRQFPLPLKFISFETNTFATNTLLNTPLRTDSPNANAPPTIEPSEPSGDPVSPQTNLVQNKVDQQTELPQPQIQNLTSEAPTQEPGGTEPLQAKLDLAPPESTSTLSTLLLSNQELGQETTQVSPQSPSDGLPPVEQGPSKPGSTVVPSADAVSNIQPDLLEASQFSEYPTQTYSTDDSAEPSLDNSRLPALQETPSLQSFFLPNVQPSSLPFSSFLEQQTDPSPEFPSILPLTTNQLQGQLFPQTIETASASPPLIKEIPDLPQQSEGLMLLPQQPSTPMASLFPDQGNLIDAAAASLESPLDFLTTDDSGQTISFLPTLQRSSTQQVGDISIADSQLDITSKTFETIPWPLETSDSQQVQRNVWELPSSAEPENSDEISSVDYPWIAPPTISTEAPFVARSTNPEPIAKVQRQPQPLSNMDDALTAPSPDIPYQQQPEISLESADPSTLQSFSDRTSTEEDPPDISKFTSPANPAYQPNQGQQIKPDQRQPLLQPGIQADISLSPENIIDQPKLEPTSQTQPSLTIQPKLSAEILPKSEELQESSLPTTLPLPDEESSSLNYIQPLDAGQPTTDGTLRAKFMPLMPPLRQPLGAWDTVQDIMKRAISRQGLQETPAEIPTITAAPSTTEALPTETLPTETLPIEAALQLQVKSPPLVAPAAPSTPENWSSLEELLKTSTPAVQREAWEEQFPLLTPTTRPDTEAPETTEPGQTVINNPDVITAQLSSADIESWVHPREASSQGANPASPSIKLTNPLAESDTLSVLKTSGEKLDDDTLEQLAQSLYKRLHERLLLDQERTGQVAHYPVPWLRTTSQRGLKNTSTQSSTQNTSGKSEWSMPRAVDDLIQTVFLNLAQRSHYDRERHGL